MSENFYLSFSGAGIEELKSAVNNASTIDDLELECLSEEIVTILIEANKPIQTLIIEEAFVDGALLKKLLTSLPIENLVFPGYDACEMECCCEDEEEAYDEPKEKKKKKKDECTSEKKFKGLKLQDEETLEEVVDEILEENVCCIKFKECTLPEEFVLWMLTELIDGDLSHIEKISISKDPKTIDFLKARELPAGITLEPKKKDGITIERSTKSCFISP